MSKVEGHLFGSEKTEQKTKPFSCGVPDMWVKAGKLAVLIPRVFAD